MNEPESGRKYFRDLLEFKFYVRLAGFVLILSIFLIYGIYSFVVGNRDVLAILGMGLLGIVIAIILPTFTIKTIKKAHLKRQYLNSTCYKVTQKPYIRDYQAPDYQYQIKMFDQLYRDLSAPLYFNVTLKDQVYDKSDLAIDLLLFDKRGIYAIQVLSYDGPLKGELNERIWKPHFYLGLNKKLSVDQLLYDTWRKANILSNPIMQTDLYVQTIQKVLPSYEVKGLTLYKDTMIDDTFTNMNERVFSYQDLIAYIQKQPILYSKDALDLAQEKIKKSMI